MSEASRRHHEQIANKAKGLLMEDLAEPKTIPVLARLCETSPTILKESFREAYGVAIYTWSRRYRACEAARMLATSDASIANVAAAVGYSNPSKFACAFRDCIGCSPREWRRQCREVKPVKLPDIEDLK